jgi:hypothetical protein
MTIGMWINFKMQIWEFGHGSLGERILERRSLGREEVYGEGQILDSVSNRTFGSKVSGSLKEHKSQITLRIPESHNSDRLTKYAILSK